MGAAQLIARQGLIRNQAKVMGIILNKLPAEDPAGLEADIRAGLKDVSLSVFGALPLDSLLASVRWVTVPPPSPCPPCSCLGLQNEDARPDKLKPTGQRCEGSRGHSWLTSGSLCPIDNLRMTIWLSCSVAYLKDLQQSHI